MSVELHSLKFSSNTQQYKVLLTIRSQISTTDLSSDLDHNDIHDLLTFLHHHR